jgi:hypothetical protein
MHEKKPSEGLIAQEQDINCHTTNNKYIAANKRTSLRKVRIAIFSLKAIQELNKKKAIPLGNR